MILTAMRRFGMENLDEIDRMTYRDFRLRLKAWELRRLDSEYELAYLAWLTREITATRKSGKRSEYIYRDFKKFFDFEKREKAIMGGGSTAESKQEPLSAAERYKAYIRSKTNG